MSGTASIPLVGGNGSPVVVNPSYVPPPNVAANDTDSNTHNNYQVVTGNDNIVVGKAVNTTVAQVGLQHRACVMKSCESRLHCMWGMQNHAFAGKGVPAAVTCPCPVLACMLLSELLCAP